MQALDSVVCGNDYTAATTISEVNASSGGYFTVAGADVYMELQYGRFAQTEWTREVHVPVGNGILQPGTTGIRFRNYVAGNIATVSAGLSEEAEPALALTAGGNATPSPGMIVGGNVTAAGVGSGGTSGWTVIRNALGTYDITFFPAFTVAPGFSAIVAQPLSPSAFGGCWSEHPAPGGVRVVTYNAALNIADRPFSFVAVGP